MLSNIEKFPAVEIPEILSLTDAAAIRRGQTYSIFSSLEEFNSDTTVFNTQVSMFFEFHMPTLAELGIQAQDYLKFSQGYSNNITANSSGKPYSLYISSITVLDFVFRMVRTLRTLYKVSPESSARKETIVVLSEFDGLLREKLHGKMKVSHPQFNLLAAHAVRDRGFYGFLPTMLIIANGRDQRGFLHSLHDIPGTSIMNWIEHLPSVEFATRETGDERLVNEFLFDICITLIEEGFKPAKNPLQVIAPFQGRESHWLFPKIVGMTSEQYLALAKERLLKEASREEIILAKEIINVFLGNVSLEDEEHLHDPLAEHGLQDYLYLQRRLTAIESIDSILPGLRSLFIYDVRRFSNIINR